MKIVEKLIAVLCFTICLSACGHDPITENVPEISESSVTEETENPAENTDASDDSSVAEKSVEDADISYIPENAAYKYTKYADIDGECSLSEISYCDGFGNDIRTISYLDDELVGILDFENEYDSSGQLVCIKQNVESFSEYLKSGDNSV